MLVNDAIVKWKNDEIFSEKDFSLGCILYKVKQKSIGTVFIGVWVELTYVVSSNLSKAGRFFCV